MAYADFSNAKLGFKIGLQSALDTMITNKNAAEGCFYLTSDTHRLYVGRKIEDTTPAQIVPVPVNEGISTVAAAANLPTTAHAGEFYYITGSNILAVCTTDTVTSDGKWLQLNQDTQLDNTNSSISVGAVSSNASTITVVIKDTSTNAVSKTFTIAGGSNVSLEQSGSTLTINSSDHTYAMSAATGDTDEANIRLHSGSTSGDVQDTIKIATDGALGGVSYASGKITIKGVNYSNTGVTVAAGSGSGASASTAGFKVSVAQNGVTRSDDIDPQIKINSGATAVSFINGVATLDGYTATEIDNKISAAKASMNAMTYCGTASAKSDITAKDLHSGDTYKADQDWASTDLINGQRVYLGDLIIVQGPETDGVIPVASASFDLVPSGDEITVTGDLTTSTNGIIIKGARKADTAAVIAGITIASGDTTDGLSVSSSTSGNVKTVTLSHKAITLADKTGTAQSQEDGSSKTFTVVTGGEIDAYGHLQKLEKTEITVKDTHDIITGVVYSASASSNVATVTEVIKTQDSPSGLAGSTGSFTIKSDTLSVTASNSQVVMDMVWGSF